jgi:hypothetical protein
VAVRLGVLILLVAATFSVSVTSAVAKAPDCVRLTAVMTRADLGFSPATSRADAVALAKQLRNVVGVVPRELRPALTSLADYYQQRWPKSAHGDLKETIMNRLIMSDSVRVSRWTGELRNYVLANCRG